MKVGITGARGLVGTALTTLLNGCGHEVVMYTRNPQSLMSGKNEVRQFIPESAGDTNVSGLNALLHLAGEPVLGYWTARKKEKIRSSRVKSS
ncbi:MAG: hypothetical protein GXP30_00015 [Verrucomicrobia bacterium]|nr:hypothetical protein [Verrucomicrobiota bacterium]